MAFPPTNLEANNSGLITNNSGNLLDISGQLLSGLGSFNNSKAQSHIARVNERIALENASQARFEAGQDQIKNDLEIADLIGTQVAIQGASGLSTNSASSQRTRETTARLGRQDSLNINFKGKKAARNFMLQARDQAILGKNARREGKTGLVGGLSGALSTRIKFKTGLIKSGSVRGAARKFKVIPTRRRRG